MAYNLLYSVDMFKFHLFYNRDKTEAYIVFVLVQLVQTGTNRPNQGRVEIYQYGKWWTVCDDNFDTNDAQVVCRMMGYSSRYCTNFTTIQTIHDVSLLNTVKIFILDSMQASRLKSLTVRIFWY